MSVRTYTTGRKMLQRRRKRKYFKVREVNEPVKELTALMVSLSIRGEIQPLDRLTDTEDILMEDLSLQNAPLSKRSRAVDGESAENPPEAQRTRPNKRKLDAVAAVHGNSPDRKRRKLSADNLQGLNFIITIPQDRRRHRGRTGRGKTKRGAHKHRHSEHSTVQVERRTQRGQRKERRRRRRGAGRWRSLFNNGGTDRLVITATAAGRHSQTHHGGKGTPMKRNSRAKALELIKLL